MSDPRLMFRLALWSVETDRPLQKVLYTTLKQLRGTFKVPFKVSICPLAITGDQMTDSKQVSDLLGTSGAPRVSAVT